MIGLMSGIATIGFLWLAFKLVALGFRVLGWLLLSVVLALVFSCLFSWVPVLKHVSAGLAIVICTVAAAAICALVCPVEEEAAQ